MANQRLNEASRRLAEYDRKGNYSPLVRGRLVYQQSEAIRHLKAIKDKINKQEKI
jgi:hypothetical protein